jgi:hypothetical protein
MLYRSTFIQIQRVDLTLNHQYRLRYKQPTQTNTRPQSYSHANLTGTPFKPSTQCTIATAAVSRAAANS